MKISAVGEKDDKSKLSLDHQRYCASLDSPKLILRLEMGKK